MRSQLSGLVALFTLTCAMAAPQDPELIRTVTSFSKSHQPAYLGNGLIGYRINPNPFVVGKSVVSGFVNGEANEDYEEMANAPYPFIMDFQLNGAPSKMERLERTVVKSQQLDMSCGELVTELEMPLGTGMAHATVLQFVSRTIPVVSCQEVRFRIPEAGTLTVSAGVATGFLTTVYGNVPRGNESDTDVMVGIVPVNHQVRYNKEYRDTAPRSKCGITLKLNFGGADAKRQPFDPTLPQSARTFVLDVKAGEELTIRTLAATVSSFYHPEPDLESYRIVNYAATLGFDELRDRNRQDWAEIWKSRVKVTGDPVAQKYLDCALFYLLSSAHPSSRTSIGPYGVSQPGYHGHVFWDTDIYMMPPLLLIAPETAQAIVEYRLRNLEQAKRRAQAYGFKGAMFPWESDTHGADSTPISAATGWMEQHITLCVGEAAWWYQKAAGDIEFARETTWPLMKSVAEWTESRLQKTDRGYEILNIMSSQEGFTGNNNSYVNALAAQVLRHAGECARLVGCPGGEKWTDIAGHIFIPMGRAGAGARPDDTIVWLNDKGAGNSRSTDMFLLGFPFDMPFDRALLGRTYDFFTSFPDGGVLDMGVSFILGDGALVGRPQSVRQYFDRTVSETTEPEWGMGLEYTKCPTTSTCFVTTMGGVLQSVMMAFTGIRLEPGNWTKYEACLPEGWSKIEIDRIYLGRKAYRIEATSGRKATLTALPSP